MREAFGRRRVLMSIPRKMPSEHVEGLGLGMMTFQPISSHDHAIHEIIRIKRLHPTHVDVIALCFFKFLLCVLTAYSQIAAVVGSASPLTGGGFILLMSFAEYRQRGFMHSLHETTPRTNLACVSLLMSDCDDLVTSPATLELIFRLRFCKDEG